MKPFIYADNAATTKLDKDAFAAMLPWLQEEYGNASQPYFFSKHPRRALAEAREIIANCIHAQPDEIYFTSGGTESDNWAIKGSAFSDHQKKATITSAFEHHAILRSCETIEKLGYPVAYLQPNEAGIVSPSCLESTITENTRLVSVMYANNEIGTIQPINALADVAHQYGACFHTDAVQAVGHVLVDVKASGVDMLSASAHKFNGPKGIGFLYVKKGITILPHMSGGGQEQGYRAGTENVAGIVGMAVALKKACDQMATRYSHLVRLEELFISLLNESKMDYIRNGGESHIPGNISISFKNADGEAIMHRLDLLGICVSTGSACNSKSTELSHVIKAINTPKSYAHGTIRISLGHENTIDDIRLIKECLQKILNR